MFAHRLCTRIESVVIISSFLLESFICGLRMSSSKRSSTDNEKSNRGNSLSKRIKLLDRVSALCPEAFESKNFADVAKQLNDSGLMESPVNRQTIRKLYLDQCRLSDASAHCSQPAASVLSPKRSPAFEILETRLSSWIAEVNSTTLPLSDRIVQRKAKRLMTSITAQAGLSLAAPFRASNGWLSSFKKRFGLSSQKFSGQGADVNMSSVEEYISNVSDYLNEYSLEQLWNADETPFPYRMNPKCTLTATSERVRGTKPDRSFVTLLLGMCSKCIHILK